MMYIYKKNSWLDLAYRLYFTDLWSKIFIVCNEFIFNMHLACTILGRVEKIIPKCVFFDSDVVSWLRKAVLYH